MPYPELIEQAASMLREPRWPEAMPEEQVEADEIFQQMYVDCIALLEEGQEGSLMGDGATGRIKHLMAGIDVEGVSSKVRVSITQWGLADSEKITLIVDQLATTRGFLELRRDKTDLLRTGRGRHGDMGETLRRANLKDARQFSAVVGFLQGLDLKMGSPLRLA